jgi:superfamily II DNA/RNA helicase
VYVVDEFEKERKLTRLLEEEIMTKKHHKTIIFSETKRKCDDLTRNLRRDGYPFFLVFLMFFLLS